VYRTKKTKRNVSDDVQRRERREGQENGTKGAPVILQKKFPSDEIVFLSKILAALAPCHHHVPQWCMRSLEPVSPPTVQVSDPYVPPFFSLQLVIFYFSGS
jgi:hypothetical protein